MRCGGSSISVVIIAAEQCENPTLTISAIGKDDSDRATLNSDIDESNHAEILRENEDRRIAKNRSQTKKDTDRGIVKCERKDPIRAEILLGNKDHTSTKSDTNGSKPNRSTINSEK